VAGHLHSPNILRDQGLRFSFRISVSHVGLTIALATGLLAGCTAEPTDSALRHVAGVTAAQGSLPEPNPGPPATSPKDESALRASLLALVNAERTKAALSPLRPSDTLTQIADYHTSRMIDGNFFAHVDPYDRSTVSARADKFDYPYLKVGENLAAGQETPADVVEEWMNSDAHRRVLLDPDFREAGVGVLDGGRHGRYWTLLVGVRADR
jgi:uncharacterized protein YkwD